MCYEVRTTTQRYCMTKYTPEYGSHSLLEIMTMKGNIVLY